jgi:ribose 5-phosphate isomerase A
MFINHNMLPNTLLEEITDGMVIGLGSGRTVALILDTLVNSIRGKRGSSSDEGNKSAIINIDSLRFIPTSLQIRLKAEALGLNIIEPLPCIDIVFDGADQIDRKLNMIKGGGGALLREKVLIHAAKKVMIFADESKYVDRLTLPIPVEVLPYARSYVTKTLIDRFNAKPVIRVNDKGYPVITENGNIILDTTIDISKYYDNGKDKLVELEHEIKCIAGVIEVGLFTKHADVYYKIMKDNKIEVIK